MNIIAAQSSVGELFAILLCPGVILIIVILMIVTMIKGSITRKKSIKALKEEMKSKGATLLIQLPHVNGLPVPEKTLCKIISIPDKFEINANGNSFNLEKNKISDICLRTDTEIQKQYVSSVGGAVGGAVLFGALGAMIGGRTKEKTSRTNYTYLIITYVSNDEIKYIGFDATFYIQKAKELINEFEASGLINNKTIDL